MNEKRSANEAQRRKPTIEALRALSLLAETEAVSEAARRLGVSQPVVSKKLQVFRDPKACGAVLLRRSNGKVILTESATAIVPAIRELLSRYDRIIGYLQGEETAPQVLRIGTGNFAVEHYLPKALVAVRDMTEECEVETRVCRGRDRIVGTAKGVFDMSIVTYDEDQIRATLREERLSESSLAIRLLGQHPLCLVASRKTEAGQQLEKLSAKKAVAAEKLTQWELVGPDRQSGIRRQLENRVTSGQLYFVAEGGGWAGAKQYAYEGLGVAIVPLATVTASDRRRLVCRRLPSEFNISDFLIHRTGPLNSFQQRVQDAIIAAWADVMTGYR